MSHIPPRRINKFLEWYCTPDRLEGIQGDAWELFQRRARKNKLKADALFYWDVIRFLRPRNIRRRQSTDRNTFSPAMIRNLILVAFRNFKRQPGHLFTNVVGLASGLACAMLILLWVTQEMSYDKFHSDSHRIFRILSHAKSDGAIQTYTVASTSMDVSSIPDITQQVIVSQGDRWPHQLCFQPEGKSDACVYFNGVFAKGPFFQLFNFSAASGAYEADRPDQIAISEKLANAIFGTTDAVGKSTKIDGRHVVTVTEVFHEVPVNSTLQFDFVMPFAILQKEWGASEQQMSSNFFEVYIRTQQDADPGALTAKLNDDRVLPPTLKKENISYEAFPFTAWRLHGNFVNGKVSGGKYEYIVLFMVIAVLVVLMAVINFINLATARATVRAKEIGIRKVTGAYRSGIILQFMGESFFIVLSSFVVAAVIVQLSLPAFNQLLTDPVKLTLLSGWIPVYAAGLLFLIAIIAGIYPAMVLSSFEPVVILRDRVMGNSGSGTLRKALLITQLSVSLGIIIFTGVIYSQLKYIINKDLGFDRQNMIHIEPTWKLLQKLDEFQIALSQHPEYVSMTASNANPLQASGANRGVWWPGKADNSSIGFTTIGCTPDFARTFGLRIQEGKDFTPHSKDTINTEVLVTAEGVKIMSLKDPVGAHIKIGDTPCIIVGVVNDFHSGSLREIRLPAILYTTALAHTGHLYIRYQPGKTQEALTAINAAWKTIEPSYTMKYWFQDDTFNAIYKTEMTASRLSLLFAIITILISIIGIVGLATFNLVRKTREIGIRRVYGATVFQILKLMTIEFWRILVVALVIAAPVTWFAANRWLTGFEYHTSMPWGWFTATFVIISLATILIVGLQAMGAAVKNPTNTLRVE